MLRRLPGGYELDDDPARLDLDAIWRYLSTDAYWHRWRNRSQVEQQIRTSWRVAGLYLEGRQVGFARALSDGVSLAYLADVYVLPEHRGAGLGRALVSALVDEGPGAGFRWLLHTADAHALYAKLGFAAPPATLMERPAPPAVDPGGPARAADDQSSRARAADDQSSPTRRGGQ